MFRKRIESHFERLRKLVRLEELEEAETFRREIRDRTPEERERSGRALLRLSLAEAHYNAAGHSLLTFRYADGKPIPVFSLDTGDMVRLAESPARDSEEWLSGTVYERTDHSITVAFNRDLAHWAEEDTLYDLTRGGGRGSFKKIYEALEKAARAEHGRLAYLRDVFLGLKAPHESDPVKLESISFFNARLDEAQKKAVKMFLESPDVCMIQGPPGTGKTTVLVEVIRQAVAQGKFVFATAPSNAACDHLLSWLVRDGVPALRLGHPARIMTHLRAHTLDFKVSNHPYGTAVDEKQSEMARLRLKLERRRERRTRRAACRRAGALR